MILEINNIKKKYCYTIIISMDAISKFFDTIKKKILGEINSEKINSNFKLEPKPKSNLNKLRNRIEILDQKKGVDSGFVENFNYYPAYNVEDLIESFENKTDYVVRKEKDDTTMVYEYDMDDFKDNKKQEGILYDNTDSLVVTDASTGKDYVYDKPNKQLLEYEKNSNMNNVNKLKYLEKRLKQLEMVNDSNKVKIDFKNRNNVAKKLLKPTEIKAEEEDFNLDYVINYNELSEGYNYTFSLLLKKLKEIGFNEKTIKKIFIDIGYNLTRANIMLKDLDILGNIESGVDISSKFLKKETIQTEEPDEEQDKELIDSINSYESKKDNKMSMIIYIIILLIIILGIIYIITNMRKSNKITFGRTQRIPRSV